MPKIDNDFDRYEEVLRKTLNRISQSTKDGEVSSSYDVHDCFILLNKLSEIHKKDSNA
jgi:hypothetical protein